MRHQLYLLQYEPAVLTSAGIRHSPGLSPLTFNGCNLQPWTPQSRRYGPIFFTRICLSMHGQLLGLGEMNLCKAFQFRHAKGCVSFDLMNYCSLGNWWLRRKR